jgi:hypothetical protein
MHRWGVVKLDPCRPAITGRKPPSRTANRRWVIWLVAGLLLLGVVQNILVVRMTAHRRAVERDMPLLRAGMTEAEVYATLHDLGWTRKAWGAPGTSEFYVSEPDEEYGEERTVSVQYENGRLAWWRTELRGPYPESLWQAIRRTFRL